MGLVARDNDGALVWMWRSPVEVSSAQEVELKGVLLALLVAKFRGCNRVLIEGDNQLIMDSLSN